MWRIQSESVSLTMTSEISHSKISFALILSPGSADCPGTIEMPWSLIINFLLRSCVVNWLPTTCSGLAMRWKNFIGIPNVEACTMFHTRTPAAIMPRPMLTVRLLSLF